MSCVYALALLRIGEERGLGMTRRRWGVAAIAAALGIVVLALGSAGFAAGAEVTPSACNTTGRLFCVDVSTFGGITASDPESDRANGKRYTWVEWSMANTGGSTLSNPKITVTVADYNCGTLVAPDPRAGDCGPALSRSSAFEMPAPPGCALAECDADADVLVCEPLRYVESVQVDGDHDVLLQDGGGARDAHGHHGPGHGERARERWERLRCR